MKDFIENILVIGIIMCILLIMYAAYAIIWEFNPFDIVAFNHKLLGTSFFTMIMLFIGFKIVALDD